jgi:hypothetical protein
MKKLSNLVSEKLGDQINRSLEILGINLSNRLYLFPAGGKDLQIQTILKLFEIDYYGFDEFHYRKGVITVVKTSVYSNETDIIKTFEVGEIELDLNLMVYEIPKIRKIIL